jgi:plastocyanin
MTPRRTTKLIVALLALVLLAGACSSKKDVGDESLLKGTDNKQGDTRLGESTTTTAPAGQTTVTSAPTPSSTAPPTTQKAAPSVEVSINSDTTAGGQFQPRVVQVPSGAIVRFTNHDSVARSVVSDDNVFDSGPIAPGASWDWTAGGAGSYNYSDGTRPYAVGTIDVV